MSRSYTPLPPSASMACSGTALPFIIECLADRNNRIFRGGQIIVRIYFREE
jgi:hypothetical protein